MIQIYYSPDRPMLVEHRYVTTFFAIIIDYKFSNKCERTYHQWERTSSGLQFPMTWNWWQRIGGWSSKASILGVQNRLQRYYIVLHIKLQGTVSSFVFCIFILRRLDYKLASTIITTITVTVIKKIVGNYKGCNMLKNIAQINWILQHRDKTFITFDQNYPCWWLITFLWKGICR